MIALKLKPIKHYCFEGDEETFKNSEQTIKLILKI
jgi:hypothetical protein